MILVFDRLEDGEITYKDLVAYWYEYGRELWLLYLARLVKVLAVACTVRGSRFGSGFGVLGLQLAIK